MTVTNFFDDITSANISTYWTTLQQHEAPYLGETLFPTTQISSDTVTWYRGLTRAPKPLAMSAFNVQAIPRDRQGFGKQTTTTQFFKESKYIDEKLRQQLMTVNSSAIPAQRDIILNHIFDDESELLRGAALVREIMRMQLLQTGKISLASNDQALNEDYQMKAEHKVDTAHAWGTTGATIFDDLRAAKDQIGNDEGVSITRFVLNQATFNAMIRDEVVKSTILANNANTALAMVPQSVILAWIKDEYDLDLQVYDKSYIGNDGKVHRFIDDGNVVFLPSVTVGTTAMAPTPESLDLLANSQADVSVVDGGVTVTTTTETDPVTKSVKVTQQLIPTFEQIDSVYVLNAFANEPKAPVVTGGTGKEDTDPTNTGSESGTSAQGSGSGTTANSSESGSGSAAPKNPDTGSSESGAPAASESDKPKDNGQTTPPEA